MRELATMQDRMNRIWGSAYDRGREDVAVGGRGSWMPPVDIFETANHEVVLKAELPGLKRDGHRSHRRKQHTDDSRRTTPDETISEDRYHRVERIVGPFLRSFTLPTTVDASGVRAEYRDGVLTVTLPTRAETRPRQIEVNVTE
jgi:HSP20 family protein